MFGRTSHPLEHVLGEPEAESGTRSSSEQNDLVILDRIRQRAVRTLNRCLDGSSRISYGKFVKLLSEPVLRGDDQFQRVIRHDGERVTLEGPYLGQPEVAVLACASPIERFLEDHACAAVGKRLDSGFVVDAVVGKSAGSNDAIVEPEAGSDKRHGENGFLIRLVEGKCDGDDNEETNMNDVE